MKGYYIEITNNLLDGKHRSAMRESVWLFMWFLDKMTSISEEGIGKVLGGKPIRFEEVQSELGISRRTYVDWIGVLRKGGYINVVRTPYGLSVSINKAKKKFGRRDAQKAAQPDAQKSVRDAQESVYRCAGTRASNIRQYQDNTKTKVFSKQQREEMHPLPKEDFLKRLNQKIATH